LYTRKKKGTNQTCDNIEIFTYIHIRGGGRYDVNYDYEWSLGKVPQSISDIELYRKSAYIYCIVHICVRLISWGRHRRGHESFSFSLWRTERFLRSHESGPGRTRVWHDNYYKTINIESLCTWLALMYA